jgi:hypothetical protein
MVCLHRIVHAEEIAALQGFKAPFCVLMVEMGWIPFNDQLLYMSTSLGGGFSGLGAVESLLERNVGEDSLSFGEAGCREDCFVIRV